MEIRQVRWAYGRRFSMTATRFSIERSAKPIQIVRSLLVCFTGYACSRPRLYGLVPCPDCVARRPVQRLVQVNRIQDLLMARAENTPNQDRDCAAERATPA